MTIDEKCKNELSSDFQLFKFQLKSWIGNCKKKYKNPYSIKYRLRYDKFKRAKTAPKKRMHLPYLAEKSSLSIKSSRKKSNMLVEDNSNTTNSSSASPLKSQSQNSNEFWWCERSILRAQEEFPNELGSKWC